MALTAFLNGGGGGHGLLLLIAVLLHAVTGGVVGVLADSACPSSRTECHASQTCHWNSIVDACVSSLPCALESTSDACSVNTFGCSWAESELRCHKTNRRASTPTEDSACHALKYNEQACREQKQCFWQSFQCQLRPTIVLSLADDLGWYDMGWNNPRARTPVLDAMRARGVSMDRHYMSRFCAPSRAMLMTGRYAWRMGLQTDLNLNPVWNIRCASDRANMALLPAVLKSTGGYATHGFGKWHLGHYKDDLIPTARGFDHFLGYYGGGIDRSSPPNQFYSQRCACKNGKTCAYYGANLVCTTATGMVNCTQGQPQRLIDTSANAVEPVQEDTTDVYIVNRARETVLSPHLHGTPLFLFMSWSTPHDPVYASEDFRQSILQSRPQFGTDAPLNRLCNTNKRVEHLAMVMTMDAAHATLIDALEQANRFDTSVFVFMSDNGANSPWRKTPTTVNTCPAGYNYPLRGAKFSWWEGGVRSVGVVYSHKYMIASKRGRKYMQLVSATDWRRTLLKASGTAWPRGLDDDGIDHWSPLSGLGVPSHETRTELPLQVWKEQSRHVHYFYYPNDIGTPELHKLIVGNAFSGWGAGNVGSQVDRYSHGEIEQPPELPNREVTHQLDAGFRKQLECASSCLFNLDRDPQEFDDLTNTRPTVLRVAMDLVQKYQAEYVPVTSSGLCEPGYYATNTMDTTDAASIAQARTCGGWVPWLTSDGKPKTSCD